MSSADDRHDCADCGAPTYGDNYLCDRCDFGDLLSQAVRDGDISAGEAAYQMQLVQAGYYR